MDNSSTFMMFSMSKILQVVKDSVSNNYYYITEQIALKHNFISSVLVIAAGVMALHYKILANVFGGCPIIVCLGPSEMGKTTALKAALSLTG